MTIHLHFSSAKGEAKNWAAEWATWWNKVAEYIVRFKVRVLTGDFNMGLARVVPELRARGIPANMVASYMFRSPPADMVKVDSTAMFVIGRVGGAESLFDANMALEIQGEPDTGGCLQFKTKGTEKIKRQGGTRS